jgi:hypothetical protein
MQSLKHLKGKRFNSLTVISGPICEKGKTYYWIKCDCGRKHRAAAYKIKNQLKSCGCLARVRHRMCYTSEYGTWDAMIQRCTNKKNKAFKNYGAKGIGVCKKWMDFELFHLDMGDRPNDKSTLDRIDNSKGYYKENCRWADRFIQNNNTSRNIFYEYDGKKLTLSQWSRELKRKRSHMETHMRRKKRTVQEYLDLFP